MKLGTFSGLAPRAIQLSSCDKQRIDTKAWSIGDEITVTEEGGYFYLFQNDQNLKVKPTQSAEDLRFKITRAQALWTLTSIKKGRFYIRSVEIADAPTVLNIDIGISTRNAQVLRKSNEIADDSIEAASKWLTDEFILEGDDQPRLFVSVYAGSQEGTLEIRGREWIATLDELDGYWTLTKLSRSRRSGAALRLLTGDIKFVDASVAGQLSNPIHRHALEETVRSHGGYMQLWQQYSDMEWVMNLEAATQLGALSFKECDKGEQSREWIFSVISERGKAFLEKWKILLGKEKSARGDLMLEVMRDLPDWLEHTQDLEGTGLGKAGGVPWLCELIDIDDGMVTLRLDADRDKPPPKEGVICISMRGDRTVRSRRQQAVNSIQQRNNPMPQLHYLLEGSAIPYERPKKIRPLSAAARKRFKGEPTPKQREALKVAMNTPDVAIIIGPPGTGKTQVITALQVRLSEEQKDQPIQHQMLVSSFQHDAVDNVMERSNVFGLPAIKVGGKRRKYGDQNENPITGWCREKVNALDASLTPLLADEPVFSEMKTLQKQLTVLRVSKPDFQQKQELIKRINSSLDRLEEQFQIRLSPSVEQRWQTWTDAFLEGVSTATAADNRLLICRVRALRTTAKSFDDDGVIQCIRLLDSCERQGFSLAEPNRQLLEFFVNGGRVGGEQLARLKRLKKVLIDQLMPDYRPRHVQQVISAESCQLLNDIHDEIKQQIKSTRSLAYLTVLDEYRSALKHTPDTIRQAVAEYSSVLGATCQQAAGEQMTNLKQVSYQDGLKFNAVIVDEAARANPLDLMVPMSMGKQRIVLVGDHRQLPHLLEPKVENELAEKFELSEVHKEMLNTSLFQRMMQNLKELEDKGQPKRVVMLDTQFRMHPMLGKFISEQFYERYGLDEVKPGLEESDFQHHVPGYEGKVCGWIDVPVSHGKSYRYKGSLQRDAEAGAIAREAKQILKSCPDLSVGVITFYSAQVNHILKAMISEGLTEAGKGNTPQIKPEWQSLSDEQGKQKERLRVGSVDAFQGKEFDVVLLSIVRTSQGHIDPDDDDALTKAYGFLRLDNRLNVAMSRQHRLLILVGDKAMATHPAAERAAPSLPAFYKLCEGSHGQVY
ncbi:AAA family ATPase [Pontibacterium sp. N1Y112]|uniref:AAA family ATPase n=1 Tax=Pontibacterium sinense TaxID=2781979 RepID=A0A8J7JXY2_9GAMM|nr:AAA domain-containing protein [Pontibacterium sinense]MBE9396813.1 AAA family ATPase [Pontibacterium sinense]